MTNDPPYAPDDHVSYLAAIGALIIAYAHAEGALHCAARSLSGIDEKLARGIFGGMRITDMCDRIRRIAAANARQQIQDEIAVILAQLNIIGKERDRIAHRGGVKKPSGFFVSNAHISKSNELFEENIFTHEQLEDMTRDMDAIYFRLMVIAYLDDLPGGFDLGDSFQGSWRYKPSQPK